MLYTPMTIKAMKIAYNAHAGQLDYNGVPYIFHPYHLAEQMEDEVSCTAALLHDVVEDTSVTMEDLQREFPNAVIEVLHLLTHEKGVDYFDYIRAIKTHPVARKIKLADIMHNSDQTRCVGSDLTEERLAYWKAKYDKARRMLLE